MQLKTGPSVVFLFLGCLTLAALSASPVAANDFATWIKALRKEALDKGISTVTLDTALRGLKLIPRVIELDRRQPEFTLTFEQYMSRVVSKGRIDKAIARAAKHREILARVSAKYGVQERFIVALWGIESDFGRLTGGFDVIPALATLAFDGRRSAFFRAQLLNALEIVDQGHIKSNAMRGSWAGAMGQVQFMPSSFLRFAVDFDGDGRKDLWGTPSDIFASAANYLAKSGWIGTRTWGRRVALPTAFDTGFLGLKVKKTLKEWHGIGITRVDGRALPDIDITASVIRPKRQTAKSFLVYGNYRTILKWNRSHYFALAVGHLADAIGRK